MPITIIAPKASRLPYANTAQHQTHSDSGSDSESDAGDAAAHIADDILMDLDITPNPQKPSPSIYSAKHTIVTPGEIITDDPQWMRGHGTYVTPATSAIISSVAGEIDS